MARAEDGFFDDLARGLADGSLTRGKALRLMGAAVVGGALGSLGIGEAGADPPGCKRNGKNCTRSDQCCSKNCSGGSCQAQTTTTTSSTTSTSTSTTSTSTTPMCTPNGSGPCTDTFQCCNGNCVDGTCCAAISQSCMVDSECCGDFTCQAGQCLPVCLRDGTICGASGPPCCSGNCVNGECAACPSGTVELSNGTCARPCDPVADEPCPEFTCSCVSDNSGGTYCFRGGGSQTSCANDSQCPHGEFCAPTGPGGGNGVCVAAC